MNNRYDNGPWDKAVEKLIRLTEGGQLAWTECRLPLRPLMQEYVGAQYVAEVEGRRVAVYEYAFPTESDDFGKYMDRSIGIEFIDQEGKPVWTWPVSQGRAQLLDAIRYQSVKGDSFLGSFLEEAVGR